MSRLFAEPHPVRLEWFEGEPRSLRVADRRWTVVEVVRRWRVDVEWWKKDGGVARDHLTLRTADGTLCEVFGDRRNGGWYLQRMLD
jgi:hypothetical protein